MKRKVLSRNQLLLASSYGLKVRLSAFRCGDFQIKKLINFSWRDRHPRAKKMRFVSNCYTMPYAIFYVREIKPEFGYMPEVTFVSIIN